MAETYIKDEENEIYIPLEFLADGSPAPYVILNDPLSDKAAGLWSCIHELNECAEYLRILSIGLEMDSSPEIAKKTLFITAVLTYMKSFNAGEGRSVQLDYRQIYKGNMKAMEYHEQLRDLRNKVFGHRGVHPIVSNKVVLYFDPKRINFENIRTKVSIIDLSYEHSVEKFMELIETSKIYIEAQLDKLLPRFRENIMAMDIQKLFGKSKIPDMGNAI